MTRPKRWTEGSLQSGVIEVRLSSWKYFSDYVNAELLNYRTYIYRGHGNAGWKLQPTLDRIIRYPESRRREEHFTAFQYAVRGRRGANPPELHSDNDWWALGQHHGLATPLLDWTESPFIALYFAAISARGETSSSYCVWAISRISINERNAKIQASEADATEADRLPVVELVTPLSDENSRLVNQRGLFTRGPNNVDLETWIKRYAEPDQGFMALIKLSVP